MGDLVTDGAEGTVQPVYLDTSAGDLWEIFPTSYNVKDSCKLLGSPSEGGLMQYDNKVTQPREITFSGIVKSPAFHLIPAMRKIVNSNDLHECLCTFYGKAGDVSNMVIESFEEIGDRNRYDAVEVKFVLREYLEHNKNSDYQ